MEKNEKKRLSWHERTQIAIVSKHGQDYWDNVAFMNTHTKAEWLKYLLEYCKRKHPERVERVLKGRDD